MMIDWILLSQCGSPRWLSQKEVNEHHSSYYKDEDIGLYNDPQPLPDDELDHIVQAKNYVFV